MNARTAVRLSLTLSAALALAACAERRTPAPVVFRNPPPARVAAPPPPPPVAAVPAPAVSAAPLGLPGAPLAASPDGVIDYGGYRAVAAGPGDTLDSMAARAGVSAAALASYNGLPAGHTPRPGDELILPPEAPTVAATSQVAPTAPSTASAAAGGAPTATAPATGFDLARIEEAIGGAPPPPQARPAEPATAAAPPAVAEASPPPPASPATAAAPVAPPPAAPPPAPAQAPAVVAALPPPAAPAPAPAASPVPAARLTEPVSGRVTRSFSRDPGARSDGMTYAAAPGTEVRAAADGQVALISESLGGDLGTVVLIRHQDQLLTVYGRVGDVKVARGDRVSAGQVIGAVAPGQPGTEPSLHFEVRRGTDPVDPADFF